MRAKIVESNWVNEMLADNVHKDPEALWQALKSMLLGLRNKFVPKKKTSSELKWSGKGTFPISKLYKAQFKINMRCIDDG